MNCGLLEPLPDRYCLPADLPDDAARNACATGHASPAIRVVPHRGPMLLRLPTVVPIACTTRHVLTGALCSAVIALPSLLAQAPRPASSSIEQGTTAPATRALRAADVLASRGDTAAAVALLDSALARGSRDGVLWHRYAQLMWSDRSRTLRRFEGSTVIAARMRADSAFRRAVELAPDSASYWLDYAHFIRWTDNSAARAEIPAMLDRAVALAKRDGRAALLSQLLDEQGMAAFRNYELEANKFTVVNPVATDGIRMPSAMDGSISPVDRADMRSTQIGSTVRQNLAEYYAQNVVKVSPPSGIEKLLYASRAFGDAVAASPANERARRHAYMVMAEQSDWSGILRTTQQALTRDSSDLQAWLARGIATQRLEQYKEAATAFNAAMNLMNADEQSAFTSLTRLLTPNRFANRSRFPDSVTYANMNLTERKQVDALYWRLADPRSRTLVNEAFLEFLARVAYADLRFSYEELNVRGSSSDRGRIFIRFGPPDRVYGQDNLWAYRNGRVFRFRPGLAYANSFFSEREKRIVEDSLLIVDPNGWENMPLVRNTWPMRMRVSRFRASADSMDAVVTAAIPVRTFLGDAELNGTFPIEVQLDVNDSAARVFGRELRKTTVSKDSLPVGINGTWVRRLGRGLNVVRVDAEQVDVDRAASAMSDAVVDDLSGFGISDILFGTNPMRANGKDPQRWRDVSIAPNTGTFKWNEPLGLVWETYDLATTDGNAKYRTRITLERTFKSNLKGFIARIAANVKNIIEQDGSGTGKVSVTYDQLRPTGTVVTDFLSISLSGAVPGAYRVEIEVLDLVSGKTVKRASDFVLVPN